MESKVSFIVKRVDGSALSFSADPWTTFIEVIGSATLADSILIHNGRMVNKYMTIGHENITNGSVIFVAKQKRRNRRAQISATRRPSAARGHEIAHINDVVWSGWELSRHHNRMVTFLIHKSEIGAAAVDSDEQSMKIDFESKISTDPLPLMCPNQKVGTRTSNGIRDSADDGLRQKKKDFRL
jgi:hypothetical protein